MGPKRAAGDDGARPSKRHHYNASLNSSSRRPASSTEQSYGQRAVFGDLRGATVPSDEDLEFEDETDALAYLRSVRHEADTIPHVLVAQKLGPQLPAGSDEDAEAVLDRSIYQDGKGDFRAFYDDGAYIARPIGSNGDEDAYGEEDDDEEHEEGEASQYSSSDGPHNSNSTEIREAYYNALMHQYLALRQVMQSEPPESVVTALPADHPTVVGNFGARSKTFSQWSGRIRNHDPLPAQIACMHKDGVIRLLRVILGGKFLRRKHELRERTSRWIWALLARLPEFGELDYQEVGWVREVGKRAVTFMLSLAEAEVLREEYGVVDSPNCEDEAEVDIEEGIDEELGSDKPSELHDADIEAAPSSPVKHEVLKPLTKESTTDANIEAAPSTLVKQESVDDMTEPRHDGNTVAQIGHITDTQNAVSPGSSDVEMEIDSEAEDGEVTGDQQIENQVPSDLEAAKKRLLAQLDSADNSQPVATEADNEAVSEPGAAAGKETTEEDEATRDAMNVRATLNMILTVAGEFYGQRDLLEFRDPFGHTLQE